MTGQPTAGPSFGFIVGVVAVMVARRLPSLRAAVPDLVALAVAVVVPLMMWTGVWGILQRLMFLTAAGWYGREAWLATSPNGTAPTAEEAEDHR